MVVKVRPKVIISLWLLLMTTFTVMSCDYYQSVDCSACLPTGNGTWVEKCTGGPGWAKSSRGENGTARKQAITPRDSPPIWRPIPLHYQFTMSIFLLLRNISLTQQLASSYLFRDANKGIWCEIRRMQCPMRCVPSTTISPIWNATARPGHTYFTIPNFHS